MAKALGIETQGLKKVVFFLKSHKFDMSNLAYCTLSSNKII